MNKKKTIEIEDKKITLQMPPTSWVLKNLDINRLRTDQDDHLKTVKLILDNSVVEPANLTVDNLTPKEALELRQKAVFWFFGIGNQNSKKE
ncbi:MAG: hypothetical protein K9K76_09745 [Halanaerobiales bacterium]|nr:hypothetical protein [Halanaerobiales bacterium]